MRDSEPMRITNLMVDKPCTVIVISMIVLIVISGIAQAAGYFELDPQNNRDFLIWDDKRTIAWDKQVIAEELLTVGGDAEKPTQLQTFLDWNPMLLFEAKNGDDLLKKEYLLQIESL